MTRPLPADQNHVRRVAYMTVDAEPDCPPFLWTWRGMTEGMPKLLSLFAEQDIRATFFTTGDAARHYPDIVAETASQGHEIGCHGYSHNPFPDFSHAKAEQEIRLTNILLREIAPVRSFRAPYLRFPERFTGILADDGITIDSSRARYKRKERAAHVDGLTRLPVSVTSSVLRLPAVIRRAWFAALADPLVLFVHPWEFVDLTRENIRLDCRFKTGQPALDGLRSVIDDLRADGYEFRRVDQCYEQH